MKRLLPYLVTIILCLITFILWVLSKENFNVFLDQPLKSLSQILALFGIILMAFTTLLSTKIRFIEKFTSGLDKAYNMHQLTGSLAFIFIINHPLLLLVQSLPHINVSMLYIFPSTNLPYTFGILALYCMILSFIFIVFIKIPYNKWRLTHKLLSLAFLLGSIHILLITSDTSAFLPLRVWIFGFIAIGLGSITYSLLYKYLAPKLYYKIEKIDRSIDVITLYLKPIGDKGILNFEPGQFVYIGFKNKEIGRELHPFSIASGTNKNYLRISAKIVGDYTLKLPQYLNEGDIGTIYGPYGSFAKDARHFKNCLWIAGGIGVTPFLSMLSNEAENPSDKLIHFYYSYRKKEDANFLLHIQKSISKVNHISFIDWCTQDKNRLSADAIKSHLDLTTIDAIFLCGPIKMMEGLKKDFLKNGVAEERIMYENFSFLP